MDRSSTVRSENLEKALERFEAVDCEDPRKLEKDGTEMTWSLLYHRRLQYWVEQLSGNPSEALLLAARCQHIRRWDITRDTYPMDRVGYQKWRRRLARHHAEQAKIVLESAGYGESVIQRVQELVQKVRLKLDPEVQLLEDAICLLFLEIEYEKFLKKHSEEKVIHILRKTWHKMSPAGHGAAQALVPTLSGEARRLVAMATAAT
jgi:hypothetical protein